METHPALSSCNFGEKESAQARASFGWLCVHPAYEASGSASWTFWSTTLEGPTRAKTQASTLLERARVITFGKWIDQNVISRYIRESQVNWEFFSRMIENLPTEDENVTSGMRHSVSTAYVQELVF